jgi:hypothetical protein
VCGRVFPTRCAAFVPTAPVRSKSGNAVRALAKEQYVPPVKAGCSRLSWDLRSQPRHQKKIRGRRSASAKSFILANSTTVGWRVGAEPYSGMRYRGTWMGFARFNGRSGGLATTPVKARPKTRIPTAAKDPMHIDVSPALVRKTSRPDGSSSQECHRRWEATEACTPLGLGRRRSRGTRVHHGFGSAHHALAEGNNANIGGIR